MVLQMIQCTILAYDKRGESVIINLQVNRGLNCMTMCLPSKIFASCHTHLPKMTGYTHDFIAFRIISENSHINLNEFLFAYQDELFGMGSTLKGKNMLLLKQILPSLLRREAKIVKLLPLEVYLPYFFVHKTEFFPSKTIQHI